MQNKEELLINEISNLREEIKTLKERRSSLALEIRRIKDEKKELIEEIKKARQRLKSVREELSKLKNERSKLVKQRKEKVRRMREIKSKLFSGKEVLNSSKKSKGLSVSKIRSRIDELEWKIITESLPLEVENEIVREISKLEGLLEKALETERLKAESKELRAELKGITIILSDLNGKIGKLSSGIEKVRENIGKLKSEVNRLQDEIELKNRLIREKVKELVNVSEKIESTYASYRKLQEELKNLRFRRKKELEEKIISRKREIALNKLRKGERLSFDDLKVLYNRDGEGKGGKE